MTERKINLAIEMCNQNVDFTQEQKDFILEFIAYKYDQNVNLVFQEIDGTAEELKPFQWNQKVLIAGPDEFFDWLDYEPTRIMVVCKNKDKNIYFDIENNDIEYDGKIVG